MDLLERRQASRRQRNTRGRGRSARPTPQHFQGPTREAVSHNRAHLANKGCISRFPGVKPTTVRGEGAAPSARRRPEVRAVDRGSQRLWGRARWSSGPHGDPRGGGGAPGGMGAGEADAVRRPRQPQCLSFGLCGGRGSPTSSAKHCTKQGREEGAPDPPQRQTTTSPRAPAPRPRSHGG